MPSFPSLHDALTSLLPGARGGPEWLMRTGMPGAAGDGIDIDDRDTDPVRGRGPHDLDVDVDAVPRPAHRADGGNGPVRHGHAGPDIPAHARQAMSDAVRGPAPQPLAPPQGTQEPSLHALARELQQLPPSVIRQLTDALYSHPETLRALPAQPQALAAVLARAALDAGPAPHAAAAEARRLVHGGDGAPVPRGHDVDAPREARQAPPGTGTDARAAGDTRPAMAGQDLRPGMPPAEARQGQAADPRPAWAADMDPALPAGVRGQGGSAEAPAQTGVPPRADALATLQSSPAAPAGTSAATPATTTGTPAPAGPTQVPATPGPFGQDATSSPAVRADAPGITTERGGQGPGLSGLGGIAAGVTLAAVANPAGTTHAHAPDGAVRARGAQKARERQHEDPASEDGRGRRGGNGSDSGARRDGAASAAAAASARSAASAASIGSMAAAGSTVAASASARADTFADAGTDPRPLAGESSLSSRPGLAAGHTLERGPDCRPHADAMATAAGREWRNPEARQSRQRQWLYWSLIAVTYACLGVALATVAPDLSGLPIAPDSLGTWRNVLTGAGLLTGLWAWLLARRMP